MYALEKNAEQYIKEHQMLEPGDLVVMGVSGGADSTALFLVLSSLREKYNLTLKVVHVDHGIRAEAKEEALIVEKLCKDQDIEFFLKEYDVESMAKNRGLGTEEMGRILRYEAFEEALMGKTGKIAVAHNKNDLSETMLFHLFRGTGIKGLASIQPVRGNVIRPLLGSSRKEIEEYLGQRKMFFCTDKSNYTNEYTRNRIRNIIIPDIEENVTKSAVNHMAETASQLREIEDYLDRAAEKAYTECLLRENADEVIFSKKSFDALDDLLKKMLTKLSIDHLVPRNKDITHVHLESLKNFEAGTGYAEINLPYSLKAFVSYEETGILKKTESVKDDYEMPLVSNGEVVIPGAGVLKTNIFVKPDGYKPSQNEYTKTLDYDKIKGSLLVRSRREGDYLTVTKNGGTKKLKDYLINEKVPAKMRDLIPVIADGQHIIWVIGYRISEDVKVTENTKNVIEITFIKED